MLTYKLVPEVDRPLSPRGAYHLIKVMRTAANYSGSPRDQARALSRLPGVRRVLVIAINESVAEIYSGGKKW